MPSTQNADKGMQVFVGNQDRHCHVQLMVNGEILYDYRGSKSRFGQETVNMIAKYLVRSGHRGNYILHNGLVLDGSIAVQCDRMSVEHLRLLELKLSQVFSGAPHASSEQRQPIIDMIAARVDQPASAAVTQSAV